MMPITIKTPLYLFPCPHVTTSDPPCTFHIGEFYKELSSHFNIRLDNTMLMATLQDQLHAFLCASEVYIIKYLLE